jgi:hypothetical protein
MIPTTTGQLASVFDELGYHNISDLLDELEDILEGKPILLKSPEGRVRRVYNPYAFFSKVLIALDGKPSKELDAYLEALEESAGRLLDEHCDYVEPYDPSRSETYRQVLASFGKYHYLRRLFEISIREHVPNLSLKGKCTTNMFVESLYTTTGFSYLITSFFVGQSIVSSFELVTTDFGLWQLSGQLPMLPPVDLAVLEGAAGALVRDTFDNRKGGNTLRAALQRAASRSL